jgi:hypothetical protein
MHLLLPILLAARANQFWYALPLIVAISLVYAATRHEQMGPILRHAARLGIWIVGFMAVVFAVLLLMSQAT